MSILSYREYLATVEISEEDRCLHGRIDFIEDLVTFEADSYPELVNAFHQSVDDYLDTCRTIGKDPDKPFSGTFNVRIGQDLHKRAAIAARKGEQTLNDWVKTAVERQLEDQTVVKHEVVHKLDQTFASYRPFTVPSWQVAAHGNIIARGISGRRAPRVR